MFKVLNPIQVIPPVSLPGTAHRGGSSWLHKTVLEVTASLTCPWAAGIWAGLGLPGNLAYQLICGCHTEEGKVGRYLATCRNGKILSYLELIWTLGSRHPSCCHHPLPLRSSPSPAFPPPSEASGLLDSCQDSQLISTQVKVAFCAICSYMDNAASKAYWLTP